MKQIRKLPGKHSVRLFFLITWISYFSIYLGRMNFSASMSDMITNGGFGKTELGGVAAAFFLSYGLGQIISGVLGDRFSQSLLVFFGLLGSAAANLLFWMAPNASIMTWLWFLNGAAQSLIWAPMARLIADRTTGAQCVRIVVLLSTSGPAGMFCAYALSAVMIRAGGWKPCFWSAAVWLLAVAVLWYAGIRSLERYADKYGKPEVLATPDSRSSTKYKSPRPHLLAVTGLGWLVIAAWLHGILKDGLITWIPTYLTETFSVEPFISITLTTLLPVVNLTGVYLANRLNRRLFNNEAKTALCFFVATLAAIIFMIAFGDYSMYGSVLVFAMISSAMTAVNTAFISLVPIHFQRFGSVSTVSGLLNATTYLGSALASVLFARTAEVFGWGGVRGSWCVIAITGAVCCMFSISKWRAFRSDIYKD